jgi:predicted Fe-Mo cluster-binding NifX family protein
VHAVVCGGMGARAVMMLNESGIKTYRAVAGSVEEVLKRYKAGVLEVITVENSCASHGCH